jgi:putative DNA primase/helicase
MNIDTAALADSARGRWPGILTVLGVDAKFLRNVHGPCPICGGKDRWRFDDKLNGSFFCSHCGAGDGFDLLRKIHGWDFPKVKAEVASIVGSVQVTAVKAEQDAESKARYMRKIWSEARPVEQGDPVWLYLSRRCGDPAGALEDIRFHPALDHSVDGGQHPAMLARMRSFDGKRGVGIHRTYLTAAGNKAQVDPIRMSYGEVAPVRLGPVQARLGVAEGIETAICAGQLFGLPVWAAISAAGMQSWEPPEGVQMVVICGDNDDSCTGQAAAWGLAKRMRTLGLAVEVRIPDAVGTDWADRKLEVVA